jgi:transposase
VDARGGVVGLWFLAQFARVLKRDLSAVEHAITSRRSNRPVEGHINRLKMIKRQMYGRAGFELLKQGSRAAVEASGRRHIALHRSASEPFFV